MVSLTQPVPAMPVRDAAAEVGDTDSGTSEFAMLDLDGNPISSIRCTVG